MAVKAKHVKRGVSLHTVDAVLDILSASIISRSGEHDSPAIKTAGDELAGYLMLDALIGNTDRHHENWAIIADQTLSQEEGRKIVLAPSFDHASSLGRELTDEDVRMRVSRQGLSSAVQKYLSKCRSAFYENKEDKKTLSPINAFRLAAARQPKAGNSWLKSLADLSDATLRNIVQLVPDERMSLIMKDFAIEILRQNKETLLESSI